MKKLITATIAVALFMSSLPNVTKADDSIRVLVNGEAVPFEVQPMIEGGSTLVPFRPVFEKLGLAVNWNGETQTVKGTSGKLTIELQIGSTTAKVNSSERKLSLAPKIVDGNTFVPLRFIGEATGKSVVWDEKNQSVLIRDTVSSYLLNTLYYTDKKLTFEVDLKDGKKNGRGTIYSGGKRVFEGEFKDDKIDGKGILYWQGGQKLYEGQWSKGFMNGAGNLYKEDGTPWYEGITMVDNVIQGTGTVYLTNGDYYKGDLVNGNPSGQGKAYKANGLLVYEGEFKKGEFDGIGKVYYADGSVRNEGEFRNGKLHGTSKYYSPNGSLIYEGSYKEDKRDGQGTLYNADGSINFKGLFKDGKPVTNTSEKTKE